MDTTTTRDPVSEARARARYLTGLLWHVGAFVIINGAFWLLDLFVGQSGAQWAFWITAFWHAVPGPVLRLASAEQAMVKGPVSCAQASRTPKKLFSRGRL